MNLSLPAAEPDLGPEPDWSEFKQPFWLNRRNFVFGPPDGTGLRVRYYYLEEDKSLVGKAWFGPDAVGPPGHAHGGSMAALLDDAMGSSAWLLGHIVLAAKIEVNFRNKLPIGSVVRLRAWVDRAEGRKIYPKAQLTDAAGMVYSESQGLFIKLQPEHFMKMGPMTTPVG